MKIGYQGIEGSNAEYVAEIFAGKLNISNPEFIPLTSSFNVVDNLIKKEIDYGVMAINNSIGGVVEETFEAVKNDGVDIISTEIIPIHQSLFKKNETIKIEDIIVVASHIQALKQTERNISRVFGNSIAKMEIADTALGAKMLSEGSIPDNVAVICRKKAGELFGLALIEDNIEDEPNNQTEFGLYKIIE